MVVSDAISNDIFIIIRQVAMMLGFQGNWIFIAKKGTMSTLLG